MRASSPVRRFRLSIAAALGLSVAGLTAEALASPPCECQLDFTEPGNGATGVPTNARVFVSVRDADRDAVTLTSGGADVAFHVEDSGGPDYQFFVVPDAALAPNADIALHVGGIDATFTTGAADDTTAPTVTTAEISDEAETVGGACPTYVAAGVFFDGSDDVTPNDNLVFQIDLDAPPYRVFVPANNPTFGHVDGGDDWDTCLDNTPDATGGETFTGTVTVLDWAGNGQASQPSSFEYHEGGSSCLCSMPGAPGRAASTGGVALGLAGLVLGRMVRRRKLTEKTSL
ncbi:MAG: hypothetical protein U0271_14505 [Polyangiaceae bacterium]